MEERDLWRWKQDDENIYCDDEKDDGKDNDVEKKNSVYCQLCFKKMTSFQTFATHVMESHSLGR